MKKISTAAMAFAALLAVQSNAFALTPSCWMPKSILEANGFVQGGVYTADAINKFVKTLNLEYPDITVNTFNQMRADMPYQLFYTCHVENQLGRAMLEAVETRETPADNALIKKSLFLKWSFG